MNVTQKCYCEIYITSMWFNITFDSIWCFPLFISLHYMYTSKMENYFMAGNRVFCSNVFWYHPFLYHLDTCSYHIVYMFVPHLLWHLGYNETTISTTTNHNICNTSTQNYFLYWKFYKNKSTFIFIANL